MDKKSYKITITGRVQGVGFRPHVYRMASEHGLSGYINNSVNGVEIEVSGESGALEGFVKKLREFPPPLAVIEKFRAENISFKQYSKFEILHSDPVDMSVKSVFVSPDLAVCADCAADIFDENNRRHGYAFTNCTNCGPRYTITKKLPYDRPVTTMAEFKMCAKCRAEYDDPLDRRFHAQPNACPDCGPGLAIVEYLGETADFGRLEFARETAPVVKKVSRLIMEGGIGALMGLGGFHIACRADSDETVARLRESKNRLSKPFALMAPSMDWIRRFCEVSPEEEALLRSSVSPIVLLRRHGGGDAEVETGLGVHSGSSAAPDNQMNKEDLSAFMRNYKLSELIAPENNYLGFMLPYTPLHMILMKEAGVPLVMTSANISDEPICYRLAEAAEKLSGICDFAMAHNREILIPCDDSVCFVEDGKVFTVRPSRGIAPCVISAAGECGSAAKTSVAVGAILKNTVSFNLDKRILISQYIGDTDNLENFDLLVSTAGRFRELYNLKPDAFVCDNHHGSNAAGYASDASAREGAEFISIGHHYAHALSVMAENGLEGPVIGLSFDGTGLGDDNGVWGGEFLVCDTAGYKRAGYFEPFRVSNYDGAVKNVSKLALCAAHEFYGCECKKEREDKENKENKVIVKDSVEGQKKDEEIMRFFDEFDLPLSRDEKEIILKAVEGGINTVKTTSLGRIFDAIAAVAGFNRQVSFEGEAAVWLEMQVPPADKNKISEGLDENIYPHKISERDGAFVIEWREMLKCAMADRRTGVTAGGISYKFHRGVIKAVRETALKISERFNIDEICLSGGVFYNRLLLSGLLKLLGAQDPRPAPKRDPFKIYLPRRVSFGDSAISAGQCFYAMKRKI